MRGKTSDRSRRQFLGDALTAFKAGAGTRLLQSLGVAGAGCAATLLSGCSEIRSAEDLARRLIVAVDQDIQTLDPAYQNRQIDGAVFSNIQETLTAYDFNLKLVPRLATSWDTPDNARTWYFHLRKGVKFHDGTPFNAEAVKTHFDQVKDPKTASPRQTRVKELAGVDALDEHTVRFRMNKPFSVWPETLHDPFACIPSPTAVRACKDRKAEYKFRPVGTGPFRCVQFVLNQFVLLERNPDYWGGNVIEFQEVLFRTIREPITRLILVEQGRADIASIALILGASAERSGHVKVETAPRLNDRYIGFNVQKPPFNDVRVRRAANYAVDRDLITKYVYRGNADPSYGPLPEVLPVFNREMEFYRYDPDRARKLLAEAGHSNGVKVVMWAMDTALDRSLAESVMEQLRAVGIEIDMRQFDEGSYWDKFDAFLTPDGKAYPNRDGVFDMFVASWTGGESPFGYLDPLFRSNSSSNSTFYSSREVDALLDQILATSDPSQQEALYKKLQAVIVADAPWIFTYHPKMVIGVNPRIEGWRTNSAGDYRFEGVRPKKRSKA